MSTRTFDIISERFRAILEQDGLDLDPNQGGDIAQPSVDGTTGQEPVAQPMTSKGEEFLVKLAYLALLYTPKDEEIMRIKSMFESAGIQSENDIRAEDSQSVTNAKNIISQVVTGDNSSTISDDLNSINDV